MHDIQVFLNFANFYQHFIKSFSEIARPLISMLRILSLIGSSSILQSLIDVADEYEIVEGESGGNETNLSKPSTSKRSTGADYLTSGSAKKGGGNTEKGVKTIKGSN